MNRLETPTLGDILIDGESILKMRGKQLIQLRKKVTMIFQQFNLLMQRTVAKIVRYPLELAGVPRAKANQRVRELLEIVGLSDKADNYPAQLSGGQKQRVAIARALASDPEVLAVRRGHQRARPDDHAVDPRAAAGHQPAAGHHDRHHHARDGRHPPDLHPRGDPRRRGGRRGGQRGRSVHPHALRGGGGGCSGLWATAPSPWRNRRMCR